MVKISAQRADAFCATPPEAMRAILVYGPNEGLVRERAADLVGSVVEDPSDPFRISELEAGTLKDDPARLSDEVSALSFSGGRRVVRLRDGADAHAKLLEFVLGQAGSDTLVVVEAGALGPRSSLRRLFEETGSAAAVPCYEENSASVDALITDVLNSADVALEPDALSWLRLHLGSDRKQIRAELEKLSLFGADSQGEPHPRPLTLAETVSCVGDAASSSLTDLANAVASGELAETDRSLSRALEEGAVAVTILRAVQRHLQRLHVVAHLLDEGQSAENAVRALRPPLFFRDKPAFHAQLGRWTPKRLGAAMEILIDAELQCKTTGYPDVAISGLALMRIAGAARRLV